MKKSLIKKLLLFTSVACVMPQAYAGWLPQWLSNIKLESIFTKNTGYALGALTFLGIGSYIWYKKFSPWSYNNKELHDCMLNETQFTSFYAWKAACDQLSACVITNAQALAKALKLKQEPPQEQYQFPYDPNATALSFKEFNRALNTYFSVIQSDKNFTHANYWVDNQLPEKLQTSVQSYKASVEFDPYVQKLVVNPGTTISFHGDLHGDIHSLNSYLYHLSQEGYLNQEDPFKIENKDNFYMVFLGDYTDRGWYGAEVVYTILRLKCENPDNVFLVRGNHEDEQQNRSEDGFYSELQRKFSGNDIKYLFTKIQKMYETLPLAFYLGSGNEKHKDFILCCHGGNEIGFNPLPLLNFKENVAFTKLGELKRYDNFNNLTLDESVDDLLQQSGLKPQFNNYLPENIVTYFGEIPFLIGFQWNDYDVDPTEQFLKQSARGTWLIGKDFSQTLLTQQSDEKNTLRGVFRAHQHEFKQADPMMQSILNFDQHDHDSNAGVSRLWIEDLPKDPQQLWNNIVCTFNVCPHTLYQITGFNYDTYGLLTVAEDYADWRLKIVRQKQF